MQYTQADLTNCDTEQVHLIGSVQSLGCLVVIDTGSAAIVASSANTETLGWAVGDLLGRPATDLMDADTLADLVRRAPLLPSSKLVQPGTVSLRGADGARRVFSHLTHQTDGRIFLEIFPDDLTSAPANTQNDMRDEIINELRALDTVEQFAEAAVRTLRQQTGYDRVMCYRFSSEGHGEVIAEDTDLSDRFLGLNYPATDIPKPARRQFALNKVRIICDVDDQTIPIRQIGPESPPVDLSFSKLRAVSSIHLQYLRNMGVAATLVLPLMVDDTLWGLLVCHHSTPKRLTAVELHASELTAQVIELLFESILRSDRDRQIIRAQELAFDISNPGAAVMDLTSVAKRLAEQFDVAAVAARLDGEWHALWNWSGPELDLMPLQAAATDGVFVTDRLAGVVKLPRDLLGVAVGAAYLSTGDTPGDGIILVRGEHQHDVAWAGAPAKPVGRDENGLPVLEPRASFGRWIEEVVGRSRPFSENDVLALGVVLQSLRALAASRKASQLAQAKRTLEGVQQELRTQLLNTARSASLGELAAAIAHELNQPLTSISNYVSASRILINNNEKDAQSKVIKLMDSAVSEAQRAGQIVHHLRNLMRPDFERRSEFELGEMLPQSARLALTSSRQSGVMIKFDLPDHLPTVYADRVQIEQVVFNLVRNAVEAMQDQGHGVLTITAAPTNGSFVQVTMDDTGPGIHPDILPGLFEPFRTSKADGMGIGLSLCRSTIEAHNGQIWGRNTAAGAQFGFTLPTTEKEGANG